jgi:hypothetical protein
MLLIGAVTQWARDEAARATGGFVTDTASRTGRHGPPDEGRVPAVNAQFIEDDEPADRIDRKPN